MMFYFLVKTKMMVLFLLLQLEEGHGSVGGKKDIHAVYLHASPVALYSCFVLPLFEIRIPLKGTFRKHKTPGKSVCK